MNTQGGALPSAVDPKLFTDAMSIRWREYGNVASDALRAVWRQIAVSMLNQIETPRSPRPVIPAELGAGKTTAAKTFCSMLPHVDHPGVLVVVRTMAQADEYAREINEWSGSTAMALAFHSGVKPRPDVARLASWPTLVVCHKGYELALDDLTVDETERYNRVMAFHRGRRRLVIIDEALDQVYVAHIPQADLRRVIGSLDRKILKAHLAAVDVLESVNRTLLEAPDDTHRVISAEALLARTTLTVEEADAALVAMWKDVQGSNRVQPDARRSVKETLTALRRHLAAYRWTESEHGHVALVGSRLLLPPDTGQVILDATGALNNVYLGRPDEYEVQTMPPVRNYRTVTLFAARTRGTGKAAMAKYGIEIAQETLDAVIAHNAKRAPTRRVLVVTDAGSEDDVRAIWKQGGFEALAVAHWWDIDGRNDWRDFDTLVVLNMPWATSMLDTSTYMAVRGVELDDEGLNAPPEEVKIIRETRIAAALAQAMGRIRLRRMTNADGMCEPCEIFARFPHWERLANTDRILDGVRRALSGVQVIEWEALSRELPRAGRAPVIRGKISERLLAMATQLSPDEPRPLTRKTLKASRMTLHRVLIAASTPGSPLHEALAEHGARVERGGYRPGVVGQTPAVLVATGSDPTGTATLIEQSGTSSLGIKPQPTPELHRYQIADLPGEIEDVSRVAAPGVASSTVRTDDYKHRDAQQPSRPGDSVRTSP